MVEVDGVRLIERALRILDRKNLNRIILVVGYQHENLMSFVNSLGIHKIRFQNWKKVWDGRNVIIVEGAESKVGVQNDLFDNVASLHRILAPAINSYDRYNDILQCALNNAKDNDLFLIALGPSAGVLVYDLIIAGYQAIDLGHLDLEYEWFLRGKGERVPVPYKYNNEFPGDERACSISDDLYESQIIANFS